MRHTCIFGAENNIPDQELDAVEGRCVAIVECVREEVNWKDVDGSKDWHTGTSRGRRFDII
jgi:hypothetical protein